MEFKRLRTAFYIALIFVLTLPGTSHALGVGDIAVHSKLNQHFNATIELSSSNPEETNSLIAELAPKSAFTRLGLEYNPVYKSLEFTLVENVEKPYIKVTSTKPIREPFLEFVLSLKWANGAILQIYTVFMMPASR